MGILKERELIEYIRLRSGMYLGTLGNGKSTKDGIYRLLQEILNFSIDEFRQDYSDKIEIKVENKQTISLRDYGTGLLFNKRTWNAKPFLKTSGITLDEELIISVTIAFCSHLEISYYKNGVVRFLRYKNGVFNGRNGKRNRT